MRLKKTLAYKDGEIKKPEKLKTLAFSVVMPLLAACTTHAVSTTSAAPTTTLQNATKAPQPVAAVAHSETPANECNPDLKTLLQPDEMATEIVCRFGMKFIMTNTSLVIVPRAEEKSWPFEPISIRLQSSRTDMSDFLNRGIVDWEPAEDAVYILTRDSILTVLPNEGLDTTIRAYEMPFETTGMDRNSMIYHAGFIFIAPRSGRAIAISFANGLESRYLPFGSRSRDDGFFLRGGELFFGRPDAASIGITIEGPTVRDLGLYIENEQNKNKRNYR